MAMLATRPRRPQGSAHDARKSGSGWQRINQQRQRRKTDVLRSLFRRAYIVRNTQLAAGRIELNQFHVTVHVTDKNIARRATEAILHRVPITIRGTVGDKLGFFKGVARSVDEDENATPKRWRVTILEEDA
jgi:hypothetical protein